MKNTLITIVLAAVVALGVSALHSSPPKPGATSISVTDGDQCLFVGGIHTCHYSVAMAATSTVLCSIKTPTATSTIRMFVPYIFVGSTSAATITLATSTSAFATSTNDVPLLRDYSVPANSNPVFAWSTPAGVTGTTDTVVGPNLFLNYIVSKQGLSGTLYTGKCEYTLIY